MALVRIRCGEPGCPMPVRRQDLNELALALIARGVMPKPAARLCAVHRHARAVDEDTTAAPLMGTERLDGKSPL
jgi:hypothetical protein